MKAAVFAGVGQPLRIEHVPDPQPGPDEVALRVERCGICASDLHLTSQPVDLFPPGAILGHELAGEIVAIGKRVAGLRVGDHVIPHPARGCGRCAECGSGHPFWCGQFAPNMGGYAEYMLSSASVCIPMPSNMPLQTQRSSSRCPSVCAP
ncbi:MAG: alcohol dehydrogenase catalytic domain-containing protein [Steroidobacteraceae bacterium]